MIMINGLEPSGYTVPEEMMDHIGKIVKLRGSVYKIRVMKDFSFVILRTQRILIQCVYSKEIAHFPIGLIKEQACISITGNVIADERSRAGYEIQLITCEILSEPAAELPIVINGKKLDVSLETLLDFRPITLRNEKQRAIFKLQEGICRGFRDFLTSQMFTEVHTPKIVYAGAEGGANIFELEYFGAKAYLAQSPQFYKQMMVGVFERVFEIGPVFRAEKHDTSRHLNEYTSVDFEMGYIEGYEEIMQMETRMLRYVFAFLTDEYANEIELLDVRIPRIKAIPAIRFYDAKQLIKETYNREIKDFDDFEPEEEKLLSDIILNQTNCEFVFVTHYPSKKRPFYAMDDRADPSVTKSFDLLFRGMEITTGGQRIDRYDEQIKKMKTRGMNIESFESYLMMHKYGMPPHGGLGLGLERFTSRLLYHNNIRLATLFPRDISRITP